MSSGPSSTTLATSAAPPTLAFGHHDVAAAWEAAERRAGRRRRYGMLVPAAFLGCIALTALDVIPSFPGPFGAVGFIGIFFAQRLLQWQRDDLLRELEKRGAPANVVAVTRSYFGDPAVRRPSNLDHFLNILAVAGVEPRLLGPSASPALWPTATR